MEMLRSVLYAFLAVTSPIWPFVFVWNLLACVKGIVQQKEERDYHENYLLAAVSLVCMTVPHFLSAFLK